MTMRTPHPMPEPLKPAMHVGYTELWTSPNGIVVLGCHQDGQLVFDRFQHDDWHRGQPFTAFPSPTDEMMSLLSREPAPDFD